MSYAGKEYYAEPGGKSIGGCYEHGAPSGARRFLEDALNRRKSLFKRLGTGVINQELRSGRSFEP
jgi:hypothetical protein